MASALQDYQAKLNITDWHIASYYLYCGKLGVSVDVWLWIQEQFGLFNKAQGFTFYRSYCPGHPSEQEFRDWLEAKIIIHHALQEL